MAIRNRAKKMSRKAIVVEVGTALFWLVFLALQLFSIVTLTRMFIVTSTDIRGTEARIFINKAVYSPHGITLQDPDTGRVYPNIIDFSKFDKKSIETAAFNPESISIGMKLELMDMNGEEIKSIFLNEEVYFSEAHSIFEDRIVVIDYGGGTRKPGILRLSVA